MSWVHPAWLPQVAARPDPGLAGGEWGVGEGVVLRLDPECGLGAEAYTISRVGGVTTVVAADEAGLMYGAFHSLRVAGDFGAETHRPVKGRRVVQHWDNVFVHPVMGQVERGYSGGSVFWEDGALTSDLGRVSDYARLLASTGINLVSVNNVNVHAGEARLLTERIGEVAVLAGRFRPYHIRVLLSVSFASPMMLGGLDTADPCDGRVRDWWAAAARQVYARIPDFGGFVVKADSEGQPGPYAYGRTHADGANVLAAALAPFGGEVYWRAFVYNHRQDWRDRSTDRARAAFEHFAPLDGRFADNVVVQVKHGPIDFQTREPVSPVLLAMPATRLAVELQATQEYTGQQRHLCYLPPMWTSALSTVADRVDAVVTVSNVGEDAYWTGHPLAQANLYAAGRLAWDPSLDPVAVLDEWISLTFPDAARATLHALMDRSWCVYEQYTAPLGAGFMVHPGDHYGPDVDGYEYSRWGTYHFADRDGVGVDRTRATGTGFTGQYPVPWRDEYESLATCPDELLLFFHHVPYEHVLRSGTTVIQHIYDAHFAGAAAVARMRRRWSELAPELVGAGLHERVSERLAEQERSAIEWRDQINTYFLRKSGVPDAHGRRIF
ncbi:alpha-glucuronidase [Dactylosporangium sp. CS-033363]|uniref:alpha-glucuronidase n=1 Tax=Dactylosporangium sp. CS-033363 TaxID=3239935 RepID=UPI003D938239